MAAPTIHDLLKEMIESGCSDLHVQVGVAPSLRVHGQLSQTRHPATTRDDMAMIMKEISTEAIRKELVAVGSVDFAYMPPGSPWRFRVNAFRERGSLAIAFRAISPAPKSFAELGLPPVLVEIAKEERGLILVTGATGSGKSTTLAAMIDWLNENRAFRIITVEDPIEFVHANKKSVVAQRELGPDARSFDEALRHALRQDPDVILIGELRDLDTIRTAIRAAETGHLVFGTLHTINAVQTVDRMISYYPPDQHELIRKQMALNLRGVISQRLVRTLDGRGRVAAVEVMRNTPIVQKVMLQGMVKELQQVINNREAGMQSFDQCLVELVRAKKVAEDEAERYATNPSALKRILGGGMTDADRANILSF